MTTNLPARAAEELEGWGLHQSIRPKLYGCPPGWVDLLEIITADAPTRWAAGCAVMGWGEES